MMTEQLAITLLLDVLWLGILATLCMDLWALVLRHLFGVIGLDYALVGRWLLLMPHRHFAHHPILTTPVQEGEKITGWLAHYGIGIIYALVMLVWVGPDWVSAPTFLPPLIVSLVSLVFPFLIMQPCFGFGCAASKTPNPWISRLKSVQSHLSYGVGLYLGAVILQAVKSL